MVVNTKDTIGRELKRGGGGQRVKSRNGFLLNKPLGPLDFKLHVCKILIKIKNKLKKENLHS